LSSWYIFVWRILEDTAESSARGRLQWGKIGLSSQSPPRKWKSLFDVNGGRSPHGRRTVSPTKLSCPKTPPAVGIEKWNSSSPLTSSPVSLQYGIGIVVRRCDAFLVLVVLTGFGSL